MSILCGIYKISNNINHKIYIGQSVNIAIRWKREIKVSSNRKAEEYFSPLSSAFRKYGLAHFSFSIIELCPKNELDTKEMFYIKKYKATDRKYGYNITSGGHNSPIKDYLCLVISLLKQQYSNKEIAEIAKISWRTVSDINCGRSFYDNTIDYPIRKKLHGIGIRLPNYVPKKIHKPSYRLLKVGKEELETNISDAIKYGNGINDVSDRYYVKPSTIKRWIKKYGISCPIRHHKSMKTEKLEIGEIKDGSIINIFVNSYNAAIACGDIEGKASSHILDCCRKKRKSYLHREWCFVPKYPLVVI